MSAESFHHYVEEEIRSKKRLYDFQDFVDCVNNRGSADIMKPEDFFEDVNEKGSSKDVICPLLQN